MNGVKSELLAGIDQPDPAIAGGLTAAAIPTAPAMMMEDTLQTLATAGASQPLPEAQIMSTCCKTTGTVGDV